MKNLKHILFVIGAFIMISSSCKKRKGMENSADSQTHTKDDKMEEKNPIPSVVIDPTYQMKDTDRFTLLESKLDGDNLILLVQYGGGCEEHEWELKTNGAYAKSLPPQVTLNLEHNANGDMCRALLTDTIEFNIEPIRYPGSLELDVKIFGFEKQVIRYKYQ